MRMFSTGFIRVQRLHHLFNMFCRPFGKRGYLPFTTPFSAMLCTLLAMWSVGCNMLDNPTIPEGMMSPTTYHTKVGGLGLSAQATAFFREGLIGAILDGGILTDELNAEGTNQGKGFDERFLPEIDRVAPVGQYAALQRLRGQSGMALSVLARYGTDLSPAVRGRLFALQGYAVILLADQFCAGVPLSTLDFEGDYTYKPSLTITQTYEQAIALFDSALAISSDSANIITLATVGKARALVGAGRLADAYAVAQLVPTTDEYRMRLSFIGPELGTTHRFVDRATVSDLEGWNGLSYRNGRDPRSLSDTATMLQNTSVLSQKRFLSFPRKYATGDSFSFVVASGIEARLIEAEHQLKVGNVPAWLTLINTLRTNGSFSRIDTLTDSTVDTVWTSGTGGVARLAPLHDPGTPESRLTLLFNERAHWLFLTGNRLPDLRRLVRVYGRDREVVFPTGLYLFGASTYGVYQSDINIPIPWNERRSPLFHGCMNRDQ